MFVFSAKVVLEAIREFQPRTHAGLERIAAAWNQANRAEVLEEVYPTLPKTSIDYGLMEPAADSGAYSVAMVRMAVQWRDIGSWSSFSETVLPDADGNRVHGSALLDECQGVFAVTDGTDRIVTAIGCKDIVIVATEDAVLVCPIDRTEEVKGHRGQGARITKVGSQNVRYLAIDLGERRNWVRPR